MFEGDAETKEMLSENKSKASSLTQESLVESNNAAGTLRLKIAHFWTELCFDFFKYKGVADLSALKNSGCSELIKNINEGM